MLTYKALMLREMSIAVINKISIDKERKRDGNYAIPTTYYTFVFFQVNGFFAPFHVTFVHVPVELESATFSFLNI